MSLTSSSLLGLVPQPLDSCLHLAQLVLKVLIVDDGGVAGDATQHFLEISQLGSVLVGRRLDQVVAGGAIYAASLAVVLVLLASLALTSFDILQTLQTQLSCSYS